MLTRRRLGNWALGLIAAHSPFSLYANAQVQAQARKNDTPEAPLIDAVRSALSAELSQLAPPQPLLTSSEAHTHYLRWLVATGQELTKRIPERQVRHEFLQTLWYEAKRAGLDVALVLGVVQVESNFRKFAISVAGARGYMQIMPFWARLIGDGDPRKLFQLQTNLRFGCAILRHYLERERGDMFLALGRYNGSRGRAQYPQAVFAAQRRWAALDNA